MGFDLMVNGHTVCGEGGPQTTLLDFLRARGLTGSKEGCAEGECGACTVVMVRGRGSQTEYVPVNSCLVFLPMAAGQEILTVEGLANGGPLTPVQQAMVDCGGSQCGYCTPGFVMSLFAEQYRPRRKSACDVHALAGNLCRCTGYRPIRDAAVQLGEAPAGPLRDRLHSPAPRIEGIESDGFSRPTSLAECFAAMARHPGAKLIAGATDLAVESNLRLRRFAHLISLEALEELRMFRETLEAYEIGAGRALAEIDLPHDVWREWLPLFASPLIRNRATLGGNLATASPIGDAAPLLLALDAQVRIASAEGDRVLPLDRFFTGYRQTALVAGELLRSVIVPKPLPPVARFYKVAKRQSDDISTVAACFAIRADGTARVAYGGVAATPVRVVKAEEALWAGWTDAAVARAHEILRSTLHPIGDHRGSAAYRLAMAQSLLDKFRWQTRGEAAA
ncbi:MAG: xanthine dehydrogenase small subunit [Proteobacteria bacterium]|nr:MAG: xanthine dehydrogenase small subunit [Pseudomonadota bacterium]